MANNKIDRINKEIAKTREKITEYQDVYKRQLQSTPTINIFPTMTRKILLIWKSI